MFKSFAKELFKSSQKENHSGSKFNGNSSRKNKKNKKLKNCITKEQFFYQMDDGTQVSKYLLEPSFLRELYLYELATVLALMRDNMLSTSTNRDLTTSIDVE